ncbi:MAG: TonB C-terminal domain-containing protein [Myxococcales bacterium]|nr:TonB C-terminal domain-containing protein [Myxococcales bacterium]
MGASSDKQPRWRLTGALSTSLLLHAALLGSGAWLVFGQLDEAAPAAKGRALEVQLEDSPLELPAMSGVGDPRGEQQEIPKETQPELNGGATEAHVSGERAGKAGSAESAPAVNLSDSDDGVSLDRDPINRLERSQVQRLETSKQRRSEDDRRATPNPMQLSFVVTGKGGRLERRPPSPYDPARGDLRGAISSVAGGALGVDLDPYGNLSQQGGEVEGSDEARTALGVGDGSERKDYRMSARVALARPAVPRARAAVPARVPGRPQDTQDSQQEVASAVRSLIQASTAGGPLGHGPGGQAGPGRPGSGGNSGPGSRSRAAGGGGAYRGGVPVGLTPYFRNLERKIDWRDAFPDWAIADGRNGLAIIRFSLGPAGEVSGVRVERPSGVAEFDAAVIRAIQRASPFGKPPKGLRTPLPIRMSFDALNPIVGRSGPGRGGTPRVR